MANLGLIDFVSNALRGYGAGVTDNNAQAADYDKVMQQHQWEQQQQAQNQGFQEKLRQDTLASQGQARQDATTQRYSDTYRTLLPLIQGQPYDVAKRTLLGGGIPEEWVDHFIGNIPMAPGQTMTGPPAAPQAQPTDPQVRAILGLLSQAQGPVAPTARPGLAPGVQYTAPSTGPDQNYIPLPITAPLQEKIDKDQGTVEGRNWQSFITGIGDQPQPNQRSFVASFNVAHGTKFPMPGEQITSNGQTLVTPYYSPGMKNLAYEDHLDIMSQVAQQNANTRRNYDTSLANSRKIANTLKNDYYDLARNKFSNTKDHQFSSDQLRAYSILSTLDGQIRLAQRGNVDPLTGQTTPLGADQQAQLKQMLDTRHQLLGLLTQSPTNSNSSTQPPPTIQRNGKTYRLVVDRNGKPLGYAP